jgi:hypothetical protein
MSEEMTYNGWQSKASEKELEVDVFEERQVRTAPFRGIENYEIHFILDCELGRLVFKRETVLKMWAQLVRDCAERYMKWQEKLNGNDQKWYILSVIYHI